MIRWCPLRSFAKMFCSNSDPDWAVPSCATVCGSFVDYEPQIRNNPIPVINQALTANSTNLASFLSNNFGIPAGTTLPPPNGRLPVPGTYAYKFPQQRQAGLPCR